MLDVDPDAKNFERFESGTSSCHTKPTTIGFCALYGSINEHDVRVNSQYLWTQPTRSHSLVHATADLGQRNRLETTAKLRGPPLRERLTTLQQSDHEVCLNRSRRRSRSELCHRRPGE